MAHESSVVIGSGLNPSKQEVPFSSTTNERHIRGTSVAVINPEDNSAGIAGSASQLTLASGVAAKLPTSPLTYRRAISVRNNNPTTGTIYLGFTSGVTTADGFPLGAGESMPMEINSAIEVWGIANVSVDVRIIELS